VNIPGTEIRAIFVSVMLALVLGEWWLWIAVVAATLAVRVLSRM
jgi:hypothetical protein